MQGMRAETRAFVLMRFSMGWYMLFDGLKLLGTPGWSSAGFLLGAQTFQSFYAWFALPTNIWWVDPLNTWGITLIGVALLIGVAVRPAAWAGAVLMVLYYFPQNPFPAVPHGYIVDEHVIYAVVFALIALSPNAEVWGLAPALRRTQLGKLPGLKQLL